MVLSKINQAIVNYLSKDAGSNLAITKVSYQNGLVSYTVEIASKEGAQVDERQIKGLNQGLRSDLLKIKGIKCVAASLPALTLKSKNAKISQPGRPVQGLQSPPPAVKKLELAKNTILVISNKGGVGKSTIASYLAYYLGQKGYKVGLLDGDVHGPSAPQILGLSGKILRDAKGQMAPITQGNISVMSTGFMSSESQSIPWRGLMASKALKQMVEETAWGELDFMIVDTPPGTSDALITLSRMLHIDGGVIITTAEDLAWQVVRRGIDFLTMLSLPILGVINNMSHYACHSCGAVQPLTNQEDFENLVRAELSKNQDKAQKIENVFSMPFDLRIQHSPTARKEALENYSTIFDSLLQQLNI